jgi:hypothetical protein
MSLLKTNLEDLLVAKTNDARKIAKSTMAHDKDDLVSDPDRKASDDDAQNNIDKALSTGHVYQESVFSSFEEQQAYIHYRALSSTVNPISGELMFEALDFQNICESCKDLSEFSDKLYEKSKELPYKLRKKFDETVVHLEDSIINETSNNLFLWKSIISSLES